MGQHQKNPSPFERQLARARAADERIKLRREGGVSPAPIAPIAGRAIKKAERAAVSAVGAALVTTALLASEDAMPQHMAFQAPDAPVSIVSLAVPGDILEDGAEEKRKAGGVRTLTMKKIADAGFGLLSMLAGALVQGLGFLAAAALRALFGGIGAGVLGFVGDVLAGFILLFLIVSFLFRLLFPGRALRELWTKRNLLMLLVASVLYAFGRRIVLLSDHAAVKCALVCAETLMQLLLIGGAAVLMLKKRGGQRKPVAALRESPAFRRAFRVLCLGAALTAVFRMIALLCPPAAAYGSAAGLAALGYLVFWAAKAVSSATQVKNKARTVPFFPADAA